MRWHDKFDLKMIKAFHKSIVQNGPTTTFIREIVTNISEAYLPPFNWCSMIHAAIDGGYYLLRKGEFLERGQEQAHTN